MTDQKFALNVPLNPVTYRSLGLHGREMGKLTEIWAYKSAKWANLQKFGLTRARDGQTYRNLGLQEREMGKLAEIWAYTSKICTYFGKVYHNSELDKVQVA